MNVPSLTAYLPRYHIAIFKELGLLDRLLTPLIILFMIIGVVIGEFAPHIRDAFDTVNFDNVSVRALFPDIKHVFNTDPKFSSYCRWSGSHDVAYPNQGSIRTPPTSILVFTHMDPPRHLLRSELDYRAIHDARARLGHSSRFTGIPHGRDYGWYRSVYCHGHDLEPTCERRW